MQTFIGEWMENDALTKPLGTEEMVIILLYILVTDRIDRNL